MGRLPSAYSLTALGGSEAWVALEGQPGASRYRSVELELLFQMQHLGLEARRQSQEVVR